MAMEFEPGNYIAEILDHKIGKANSGNYQIIFTIRPIGEVDKDDPNGDLFDCPQGKTRTVFATITDKTKDRRVQELKAMGYTGKGWANLDKDAAGDAFISLAGKKVPVTCKSNVYQGNEKEQWEFNFPGLGGAQIEGASTEDVRKLDALFGGAFGSNTTQATPAPQATNNTGSDAKKGKQKSVTVSDDKIPF